MQSQSSEDLRSTPSRSSSLRAHHTPSPLQSHRQSFTDSLRGHPPSPRATRQPSLSQAQLQELLNNPPTKGSADPRFVDRDWQHIGVGELCDPADLRWVEFDSGIEDATNVRHISHPAIPIVIRLTNQIGTNQFWSPRPSRTTPQGRTSCSRNL